MQMFQSENLSMTEKEKMLAGLVYSAVDEELLKELNEVKDIIHKYNSLLPSASKEMTISH